MKVRPMRGVAPKKTLECFPYLISAKIDGMRALVKDGMVMSKTMKPIPNSTVQNLFGSLEGFDGELTVGPAHKTSDNDDVFARSRGPIMRKEGEADFRFHVFDLWNYDTTAADRYKLLQFEKLPEQVEIVTQYKCNTQEEVDEYYQRFLEQGYEGAMLRRIDGLYKFGQSTEKEGYLLKLKNFLDAEAQIIGFIEQMENTNEKTTNELGYSVRSMAQDGFVGKDTLGAFVVRDLTTGVEFNVGNGPGLTQELRKQLWEQRDDLKGLYIRYKYQEIGTKDAPRLPQFLGFRDAIDISEVEQCS